MNKSILISTIVIVIVVAGIVTWKLVDNPQITYAPIPSGLQTPSVSMTPTPSISKSPQVTPTSSGANQGACNSNSKPCIKVLSPNGGEEWKDGQIYKIQWTSSYLQGLVSVQIVAPNGESPEKDTAVYQIETDIPGTNNSGEHSISWKIPPKFLSGTKFKIKAYFGNLSDMSDNYFAINRGLSLAPSPTDTTNWQTYKNNQYGFEFKYPPSWPLKIFDPVPRAWTETNSKTQVDRISIGGLSILVTKGGYHNSGFEGVVSLDKYFSRYPWSTAVKEEIIFAGIKATQTTVNDDGPYYEIFFAGPDNSFFQLIYGFYEADDTYLSKESMEASLTQSEYLKQLLSSFKFTK